MKDLHTAFPHWMTCEEASKQVAASASSSDSCAEAPEDPEDPLADRPQAPELPLADMPPDSCPTVPEVSLADRPQAFEVPLANMPGRADCMSETTESDQEDEFMRHWKQVKAGMKYGEGRQIQQAMRVDRDCYPELLEELAALCRRVEALEKACGLLSCTLKSEDHLPAVSLRLLADLRLRVAELEAVQYGCSG